MHILIILPSKIDSEQGNTITALRYKSLLEKEGHTIELTNEFEKQEADIMIALHALKSFSSINTWKKKENKPCIIVLSGTDIYEGREENPDLFKNSLDLADHIIVLQATALEKLNKEQKRKTSVVFQSVENYSLEKKEASEKFKICVIGHLRSVKNPFYTIEALSVTDLPIEIIHVGNGLLKEMSDMAHFWMKKDTRYTWVGNKTHLETLEIIAKSDILSHTSISEGGANAIAESLSLHTPVIASLINGNRGMLGEDYEGYFELQKPQEFVKKVESCIKKDFFYEKLKNQCTKRSLLFHPKKEQQELQRILRNL